MLTAPVLAWFWAVAERGGVAAWFAAADGDGAPDIEADADTVGDCCAPSEGRAAPCLLLMPSKISNCAGSKRIFARAKNSFGVTALL